jgi:hypothetical protein
MMTMKVITIRNVPDDLYRLITRLAERNRRSIQQEVMMMLERSRILDTESPADMAKRIRNKLAGRNLGNTVDEIREERNR